jgi:hypothetical protein
MEDKVVKCILLDVDTVLITELIEMDAQLGDPNCKLVNPYRFTGEINDMKPWKSDVTNQSEFMIRSDEILTIADPTPEIIEKYLELAV